MSSQNILVPCSSGKSQTPAIQTGPEFAKRVFDVVSAAMGLVVVSPVLALAALLIKLDSRGPVFYRGIRAGRFGRPFRIFKLRTMSADAERRGGSETAADDPRITRVGAILRRCKVDEFPQLINVIKGEMSIVGPRPEVMAEVVRYTEEEQKLLLLRPGITDRASIKFRWEQEILRGSSDPHATYHEKIRPEKVRLGLDYVHKNSLWIDLCIIFATLKALWTKPEKTQITEMQMKDKSQDAATVVEFPSRETLAIDGGTPVRTAPFAPWPYFPEDEIGAAVDVLRSGKVNYWTGDQCRAFESEFAGSVGRKHAVALANGTVALELGLRALGIGPGDEVVVPSRTFIASASCAVAVGATPVIADVDLVSQTLTAESVRAVLTPRTRAIVAVHLAGWPCDMDSILQLAREHNLKVIEDCAQAHGALYKGRRIGSMGDVAAFSFCQDKIMTTAGEGGMLVLNDEALLQDAWSYKDHGKNLRKASEKHSSTQFRWLHDSFGTNWRMTEFQAAIGRVLLRKLEGQVEVRRRNAAVLSRQFAEIPALRVTVPPAHVEHAYYKYYAFLRPEMLSAGWTRDRIISAISAEGVPCSSGSCSEIYLEQAFPESMRPKHRLAVARELGETSLMFLVHPTLWESDMRDTARAVEKVFRAATASLHQSLAA